MTTPATLILGLIADDLTGASDTAVQFARRGWKAILTLDLDKVRLTPDPGHGGPSVLAVTTDTRALEKSAAERLTADAVAQLTAAGVNRIYLKIDSTMRGSVPGQIAGALAEWRKTCPGAVAVVCPAYPRMGRTVEENQLLVDGRPVEASAIGRDPVTPVKTSDMAALVPGSRHVAVEQLVRSSAPIVTVDARSDEDLASLASKIAAAWASVVPVGSAGLAGAMAEVWSAATAVSDVRLPSDPETAAAIVGRTENPRILIQVTSLNPVSDAQVARLAEAFPGVVVLRGRAQDVAGTFADLVERERWDLLGLIGGDGARAALRRLDASAIRIVDALLEGVPLGTVVGGRADGMPVFTKAGGFGAEDALVRIVERIAR